MIVTRERQKLLNAIVFFCEKTKHCHTLKLFKLLNFLDFEHYRQTGRSVTGLDYKAFEMGPVPPVLWEEIKDHPGSDMQALMAIIAERDHVTSKVTRREIRPKAKFTASLFSKRELAIMDRLAEFFKDAKGEDMSEFSHIKGLPWRQVWQGGKGRGKAIPLDLALTQQPIVYEEPTIDDEELTLRRDLRRDLV